MLNNIITNTHKEIAGSRTKNRLTVQISYALQLIMEFYSTDFLIMMDYIEDVSVILDPNGSSSIHLYQVKTKSSDKQYLFSTIIKEKWFQKLYSNALKYQGYLQSASIVCNTDIVKSSSGSGIFPNSKTSLDDATIQSNIRKIRSAIALDQSIDEKAIDLSKFYFIRSMLSTKGHKNEVEHQFQDFLYKKEKNIQVATTKAIFSLIFDTLDRKFNQEITENCTAISEIYNEKGFSSEDIKQIISTGLMVQIPHLEDFFSDFKIISVSKRRSLASNYTKIKMDMVSNTTCFIKLKKTLFSLIETTCASGIDDMFEVLDIVYSEALTNPLIPDFYKNESYLKMMIMLLIYKYCRGRDAI